MLFTLLCIMSMWVMILGVGCYYMGVLSKKNKSQVIVSVVLSLFVAVLIWLVGGYSLAFFGNLSWSVFSLDHLRKIPAENLLEGLFQLCFCLYAVVMLIGSVIERVSTKGLGPFVGLWVLLVYVPLVYWFWHADGWLKEKGVLDFSGGMVVHLSAGVSSYVLAQQLKPKKISQANSPKQEWLYLGMLLISFGWFGFNAGPVGDLNQQSVIILINTFLAMVGGGLGWYLGNFLLGINPTGTDLLNGMITGLVGSTSGVGFVSPSGMLVITLCAGLIVCVTIKKILSKIPVYDSVDSFGMNGIGGLVGSIGTAFFANRFINPRIELVTVGEILIAQLIGIGVTVLLAGSVTWVLSQWLKCWLCLRIEEG